MEYRTGSCKETRKKKKKKKLEEFKVHHQVARLCERGFATKASARSKLW
jgi:hypothetical protein